MYVFSSFDRASLLLRMQARTSLRTASLLVRDAIIDLLNNFPKRLLKLGICVLGVCGLLMFEDATGDIGVLGVEDGFAVRENSPNRTLVILFLGGILILFIELKLV